MNNDPTKRYVESNEPVMPTDEWAWNDEDRWSSKILPEWVGKTPWDLVDVEHSHRMFRRKI